MFFEKKSGIEGMGCFALRKIKKGELICDMEGEEISITELKRRFRTGKERADDPLQIRERRYRDLKKPYVYFNHSCRPNAAIVGVGKLIAIKNIPKGDEITYDYSATVWVDERDWPGYGDWMMKCHCGVSNCRKRVTEFQNLPGVLQKKYVTRGWVQDFILRKYRRHISST